MWFRRSKSRFRVQFACSSFKDIHTLLSDEESAVKTTKSLDKPLICHRSRSSINALVRTTSHSQPELPLNVSAEEEADPEIGILGADESVVVYYTSLRVVRRTFDDCKAVRTILGSFRVLIDERDVSMDSRFMDELQRILRLPEKSKLTLPRVFIGGRYIGGVEEVRQLNERGELKKYVETLPAAEGGTCEVCGGYRFLLCQECSGSHKCYRDKVGGFRSCTFCNENGLIRCPSCSTPTPFNRFVC